MLKAIQNLPQTEPKEILNLTKSVVKEFQEFAIKGNVIDLAVGVVVGGAFNKIVTSLLDDLVMPPIGLLIGGVNFRDLVIIIKPATENSPGVNITYGNFIQVIVNFIITAGAIFILVKLINQLKRREEIKEKIEEEIKLSGEEKLLIEIRDLLAGNKREKEPIEANLVKTKNKSKN